MNFLFPLYLLGAAAIAIPILLHLRRRPPQNAVPFSALMFLEGSPVPPVKRRRVEDLLLLLLRCLALLLLALLFSRPLWRSTIMAGPTHDGVVILLDRSASMQREDLLEQVEKQLDAALAEVKEGDDVALVTYEREPALVVSSQAWRDIPQGQRKAFLRDRARQGKPSWGGTDLGKALVFAAGLLDAQNTEQSSRRILLISDMQEGSALEALGTHNWPQEVVVKVCPVISSNVSNLALSPAAQLAEEGDAQTGAPVRTSRVRVINSKGSRLDKFSLAWAGQQASKQEGTLAAAASRIIAAPARTNESVDGVLEITGDTVPFDNRVNFARQTPRQVRVLVITDNPTASEVTSPLFYLSRALRSSVGLNPSLVAKTAAEVKAEDFKLADFCIVTGKLQASSSDALNEWISEGHAALYVSMAGDDGSSLARLTGLPALSIKESTGNYAMLAELDFEQPVLKPFADSGVRDFTKIRFWKHRVMGLPPQARKLASFDDGSPALSEMTMGTGRLFVLSSGWTPAESQLGVSSKFVPLLYSMFDSAGLSATPQSGYLVGDAIPLEPALRVPSLKMKTPAGDAATWDGKSQPAFTATDAPGIYVLGEGGATRAYAVNLAPNEGRIAPLDPSRLREYGVKLQEGAGGKLATASEESMAVFLEDQEREQNQKLWKVVAAILIGTLLLETLVAALREARPPQTATS